MLAVSTKPDPLLEASFKGKNGSDTPRHRMPFGPLPGRACSIFFKLSYCQGTANWVKAQLEDQSFHVPEVHLGHVLRVAKT